jgi:hypothetical protein
MATYKELKGTNIEAVATDPTYPVTGQVWYNTTSNVLKGATGSPVESWSTVNSINSIRYGMGSAGTSTAALAFGGNPPTGPAEPRYEDLTESWNGTNWTEVNDMNQKKQYLGSVGIQTAALSFAGQASPITANTEVWNGTNWTEVNNMSEAP